MRELKLSAAQEAKLAKAQSRQSNVDDAWYTIAKFGEYYGWDGVQAILDDEIELEVVEVLLKAHRKIDAQKMIDLSIATSAAYGAANAKNPKTAWKKAMKEFIKEANA